MYDNSAELVLSELDTLQDEVLARLDMLNQQIEEVLKSESHSTPQTSQCEGELRGGKLI